jgi:hypothetical protein
MNLFGEELFRLALPFGIAIEEGCSRTILFTPLTDACWVGKNESPV